MRSLPSPEPQHPKLVLHDAIQTALRDPRMSPEIGDRATLTRWALVGELMLPAERRALVMVTSTIDGTELQSWESMGLYVKALQRAMRAP